MTGNGNPPMSARDVFCFRMAGTSSALRDLLLRCLATWLGAAYGGPKSDGKNLEETKGAPKAPGENQADYGFGPINIGVFSGKPRGLSDIIPKDSVFRIGFQGVGDCQRNLGWLISVNAAVDSR